MVSESVDLTYTGGYEKRYCEYHGKPEDAGDSPGAGRGQFLIGVWNPAGIKRRRFRESRQVPWLTIINPCTTAGSVVVAVHLSANRDEVKLEQLS